VEKNQLYYGDNLEVLRQHIKDESVDLIYLDPPFNSRQDYNVLFAEKDGTRSSSQIMAFEDTWEWNVDAERAYEEIVEQGGRVSALHVRPGEYVYTILRSSWAAELCSASPLRLRSGRLARGDRPHTSRKSLLFTEEKVGHHQTFQVNRGGQECPPHTSKIHTGKSVA
jgi:hypothetical protein